MITIHAHSSGLILSFRIEIEWLDSCLLRNSCRPMANETMPIVSTLAVNVSSSMAVSLSVSLYVVFVCPLFHAAVYLIGRVFAFGLSLVKPQ